MRILEINKFYHPRRGAERHFIDLVELLRARGHEVEVFAMAHPQNLPSRFAMLFPSYVGFRKAEATLGQRLKGLGRLWSWEARQQIRKLLRQWRPDAVHLHNIYHQLSPSILKPLRALGVPIIMTVHDYNIISPDKDAYYPSVGRRYWKFLLIRKYSLAKRVLLVAKAYWEDWVGFYRDSIDHFIVPSEYVARVFRSAGVPGEKIKVVPHFVPDRPPESSPEQPGGPYALYAGSLTEEKGVNQLIALFDELGLPLRLAGPQFMNLPQKPGLDYLGMKKPAELARLMKEARLTASASQLPETFGLTVAESLLQGTPFFGYHAGAYSELVTNGENGWLAHSEPELREKIEAFWQGKLTLASSESIRAKALARFGEERYYHELLACFRAPRA